MKTQTTHESLTVRELEARLAGTFAGYEAHAHQTADGSYIVSIMPIGGRCDYYTVRHSAKSQAREWKTLDALVKSLANLPVKIVVTTPAHDSACDSYRSEYMKGESA